MQGRSYTQKSYRGTVRGSNDSEDTHEGSEHTVSSANNLSKGSVDLHSPTSRFQSGCYKALARVKQQQEQLTKVTKARLEKFKRVRADMTRENRGVQNSNCQQPLGRILERKLAGLRRDVCLLNSRMGEADFSVDAQDKVKVEKANCSIF